MTELTDGMARYLAVRAQQREDAVQRTLDTLTPYERRLVREAAVMGYVRGVMAGRAGRQQIPPDSDTVAMVIDACLSMADLYPVLAAAGEGVRAVLDTHGGQQT